jgi:predicted PurR-regulated permease PerM
MPTEQPVPRFFLALTVAATVLLGMVIFPVARELFLAAVLAGVLWRPQQWLAKHLRGHRALAASIVTVIIAVVIVGPVATLATYVIRDGSDTLRFVASTAASDDFTALMAHLPAGARDVVTDGIARVPADLGEALGLVSAANGTAFASAGATAALHGAFMLIALFSLLVSGDELVNWLDSAAPLAPGQTRALLAEFKRVSFAVIVSTLITAAVQAFAALVGYLIARVPNALFFTMTTFLFAFVPAIGAGVICLIAAALLVVTGHPYMAIFLAAWGVVVVGLSDNLVKPLLIKRGMDLHGAVVFFALVGGIASFGAIGLLLGPLVVALFLALVRMYHADFSPELKRIPAVPGHPPRPTGADAS